MDNVLKTHEVFLAHCITREGGAGNEFSTGKTVYERIKYVIEEKPEISCSTISKGDKCSKNYFGPVGIILKNVQISFASPIDAGTRVVALNKRDFERSPENLPTTENIKNAIKNRSNYNEFCVEKYDIFGVFLCFDEMDFLMYTIESERKFYESTADLFEKYFILNYGTLHTADFNKEQSFFYQTGIISLSEIY